VVKEVGSVGVCAESVLVLTKVAKSVDLVDVDLESEKLGSLVTHTVLCSQ
jgi:hypothetical protein